ncbi:type II toxin-antitoxin system RelE/ParE family toxin [Desulfobacterales bacterium HSG2]|nr:type II toxin-antitoxin system RelE/ParE family toxin [Desulfobacterales bacterium HSG2]
MIKDFFSKDLENFFYDGTTKKIRKSERILDRLEQAGDVLKDMSYPGSCLHKLEPKKEERWAVKVDKNWRVTFRFTDGDAYEVDYTDYH